MSVHERRAVEMFARWVELVDAEIRAAVPDLPQRSWSNGHRHGHLRAVRASSDLHPRDSKAIETFLDGSALYWTTCRSLFKRYAEIERRAGKQVRQLLLAELTDSFSSGSRELFGWVRNRSRAWLLLCIVLSAYAHSPQDPFVVEVSAAYWRGILIHAYPQWLPWFMSDYAWLREAVAAQNMVLDEDEPIAVAGDFNDIFHEYAVHGELLGFMMIAEHYAHSQHDDDLRARLHKWRSRHVSRPCFGLRIRLEHLLKGAPSERTDLLRRGATHYCEMMVAVAYGQLEAGATAAADTPLGREVIAEFFPGSAARAFLNYAERASLGGFLGGVEGCQCLLRALQRIDAEAHGDALRITLQGGRARLNVMRRADSTPDSQVAIRHVAAVLERCALGAVAKGPTLVA